MSGDSRRDSGRQRAFGAPGKSSRRLLLVLMASLAWSGAAGAISNEEILRQADQARGNLRGVTWEVTLVSKSRRGTESQTYDVKARGFDIMAESSAPPKYKGNRILMIKGNVWFHHPDLSKPVPISQRQRLLGNAAYGDIAATNYAHDYEAVLLGEEKVGEDLCYLFDLKSKDRKSTYDRIKYWIAKERLVGVKAEYYTVSGKKFKSALMRYDNEVKIDGRARPFISRITISDEILSGDVTTLDMTAVDFAELPDYVFNLNLLRK